MYVKHISFPFPQGTEYSTLTERSIYVRHTALAGLDMWHVWDRRGGVKGLGGETGGKETTGET